MKDDYKYVRIQGRHLVENTLTGKGVFGLCMELIRNETMGKEDADLYMEIDSWFAENLPWPENCKNQESVVCYFKTEIVNEYPEAGITSKVGTPACPNTMTLEGGKYAVYRYAGYPQQTYLAYQSFFFSWLSATGNKVDNRGGFDIYRRIDTDTLYMELDICIPIV